MTETESAPDLIRRWREGDQSAAEELYRQYSQRLLRLAEKQLDRRLGRRIDADDVVQSVFRSFFRRTAKGEYPIVHSGSLWRLLVQITLHKVQRQRERHHAKKRDVAAEVYPENCTVNPEAVARDPSAEEVVALLDELDAIIAGLRDPEPEILRLSLEGYSSSEIATRVGCSRWTIRRVLGRIGNELRRRLKKNSGNSAGFSAPE